MLLKNVSVNGAEENAEAPPCGYLKYIVCVKLKFISQPQQSARRICLIC